jgi:hypothetical protein
VGVEKGTKAVISVNFTVHGERKSNDLQTSFDVEIPSKEFFNTHTRSLEHRDLTGHGHGGTACLEYVWNKSLVIHLIMSEQL